MKLCSRATIKSRKRFADSLPYAVVSGHLTSNPTYGYGETTVVRGMTLTVTPGVWADAEGTPTVVGYWADWNLERVAADNVTIWTVPMDAPEDIGYGYLWMETATQNGRSETTYYEPYVLVASPPAAPQFNGYTPPTSSMGSHTVGATLTRPVIRWWSPLTVTAAGQWVKNDIPTGVSTTTYSDTAEGDRIQWREIATDALGTASEPYTTTGNFYQQYHYVSAKIAMLVDGMRANDGLVGGKTNMKMWNVKNHATGTYQWNPDMWLYDLRSQLTGRAVTKTGMNSGRPEDYGGTLITPRHLLYCAHAFPHAANTWGVNLNDSRPCVVRFVLADNTVVDAVQIHQQRVDGWDLCVATLDRDVQALGVHVMPLSPYTWDYLQTVLASGAPSIPVFSISQGYNTGNEPWSPLPVSDYDYPNHDVLCYIVDWYNMRQTSNAPVVEPLTYQHFNFAVYDGDSGTPAFFMYNNVIYLMQITTTIWSGPKPANAVAAINATIIQSDQNAINMGRLSALTGLTVALPPDPIIL